MTSRTRTSALATAASVLFILALPVFLITTNIRFLASEAGFYERGFREHDSAERTGLELAELDRAAEQIIDYFGNDARTLRIIVLDDGEEVSLFNADETRHMEDVKGLMRALYRVNEVSLAVLLVYVGGTVLWAREHGARQLARRALIGMGVGAGVAGAVGALALTGFDAAWTRFHEIAFQNDLWQLDPETDRLIQMFPEEFWAEATLVVAGLTVIEVAAIVVASAATLLMTRRPGARPTSAARVAPMAEPGDISLP